MPLYEYACKACEHQFEMLQPIGAAPPDTCPACGEAQVRKLVSTTSFILKGSGWYKDHYGLKTCASSSESSACSSSSPSSTSNSTATTSASSSSAASAAPVAQAAK